MRISCICVARQKNSAQNALECIILIYTDKIFAGEGHSPSPEPSPLGRGKPSRNPSPLPSHSKTPGLAIKLLRRNAVRALADPGGREGPCPHWGGGSPLPKPHPPWRLHTRVCGARPLGASILAPSAFRSSRLWRSTLPPPVCKSWIRHWVRVRSRGVSHKEGRDSVVGKICETGWFKSREWKSERLWMVRIVNWQKQTM